MAVAVAKLLRTSQCLRCVSVRSRSHLAPAYRYLSTSNTRYRTTPKALQAQLPADKYQGTTITEDVRTAASQANWADPRSLVRNPEETADENMIDPTIRHFTINFVCRP
jgi:hypothetical protein